MPIRSEMLRLGASLLLVVGSATPGVSQAKSGADGVEVHQRNDCRLAHQVLVHGQPANKQEWAIGFVNNCGALGGEALSAVLSRFGAVGATGGEMERLVQSAAFLTDERIFKSALALAADRSATITSRVQAIRIAYHQLNPATYQSYEAFVSNPWETKIVHMPSVGSEAPSVGTPLSGNPLERAARSMSAITADFTTPQHVRRAATYVLDDVEWKKIRMRLCAAGISREECTRRLDAWEAQQDTSK